MAIIIGDIHGDVNAAVLFIRYRPEARHIALGDVVDTRRQDVSFEDEQVCLLWAMTTSHISPSDLGGRTENTEKRLSDSNSISTGTVLRQLLPLMGGY